MQYKVPQNVDIEDKVIAGLTLRQFMFLMISGGIILMLNYMLPPELKFLFMPLAVMVGGFGIALAFVKINDRPLELFLGAAAKTILTPPKRTWQKEIVIEESKKSAPKHVSAPVVKENVKNIKSNLEKLAVIVDSGGAHNMSPDNRASNIRPSDTKDDPKLNDILDRAETPSEKLVNIMNKAKRTVGKKTEDEMPISTLSTNNPEEDKKSINYENIQMKSETELNEILKSVREEQQEKEEELKSAVIKKFDRK